MQSFVIKLFINFLLFQFSEVPNKITILLQFLYVCFDIDICYVTQKLAGVNVVDWVVFALLYGRSLTKFTLQTVQSDWILYLWQNINDNILKFKLSIKHRRFSCWCKYSYLLIVTVSRQPADHFCLFVSWD